MSAAIAMLRASRPLVAFVVAAALTGCANLAQRTSGPTDLTNLSEWRAQGRLGVSGAESGGSGSFDWRQKGERADIQIRGPIGLGSVRMQLRGSGPTPSLQLETGDGRRLQADAAWSELEARLGAPVPASELRYWMIGLPAPGEHRWLVAPGESGAVLEQSGWRIDYQKYSGEPGVSLPIRMRASNGDARVRIVVDRWRLGE